MDTNRMNSIGSLCVVPSPVRTTHVGFAKGILCPCTAPAVYLLIYSRYKATLTATDSAVSAISAHGH